MRSPFAYTPRPGPLQAASPGAAVAYLGAFVAVAFLYSSPAVLAAVGAGAALAGVRAGASTAVRSAVVLGLAIALPIVAVNALVVSRGETVLGRLGEWPLLGPVDVTAEAIADGCVFGLRAVVVMIAFAVYSSCVDPDRVLRALRPIAGRSALTATLISRLVPVAAADATRLRDAGRLRGPGAAPLGRSALLRRLLAGSLDRAVDVAATLELRGYSLSAREATFKPRRARLAAADAARRGVLSRPNSAAIRPPCVLAPLGPALASRTPRVSKMTTRARGCRFKSRYDARFYAVGAAVVAAAIAAKLLGADGFEAYPTVALEVGPATLGLCLLLALAGLAPSPRGSLRTHAEKKEPRDRGKGGGRG